MLKNMNGHFQLIHHKKFRFNFLLILHISYEVHFTYQYNKIHMLRISYFNFYIDLYMLSTKSLYSLILIFGTQPKLPWTALPQLTSISGAQICNLDILLILYHIFHIYIYKKYSKWTPIKRNICSKIV